MVQYCFRLIQIQFYNFHSMFRFIARCSLLLGIPIRISGLAFEISNFSPIVEHYYEMVKAFEFELIGEPLEWIFTFCKVHSNKQIETTKTILILHSTADQNRMQTIGSNGFWFWSARSFCICHSFLFVCFFEMVFSHNSIGY